MNKMTSIKFKPVLKFIIFLALSLMAVYLTDQMLRQRKILTGTVIQIKRVNALSDSFLHSPSQTNTWKILLETGQQGKTTSIFILHDKPLFVGQIIEVQAQKNGYKIIKTIK